MLRPNRSIPAAKVVGRAVLVAPPADSFWVLGIERYFWFRHSDTRLSIQGESLTREGQY